MEGGDTAGGDLVSRGVTGAPMGAERVVDFRGHARGADASDGLAAAGRAGAVERRGAGIEPVDHGAVDVPAVELVLELVVGAFPELEGDVAGGAGGEGFGSLVGGDLVAGAVHQEER